MSTHTITDPTFGTHTAQCHAMGWYLLDWDSGCLRPGTVTEALTEAEQLDAEVHLDRALDDAL